MTKGFLTKTSPDAVETTGIATVDAGSNEHGGARKDDGFNPREELQIELRSHYVSDHSSCVRSRFYLAMELIPEVFTTVTMV